MKQVKVKKANKITTILRMLCVLAVMFVFMKPAMVLAESPATIMIGSAVYTLAKDDLPSGLSWDGTTLTLNNYTGTCIASTAEGADLKIHLIGNNVLTGGYGTYRSCLYTNKGNITITADTGATLKATSSTSASGSTQVSTLMANDIDIQGGDIEIVAIAGNTISRCYTCYDADANPMYKTLSISGNANVTMKMDASGVTKPGQSQNIEGGRGKVDISTSGNVSFYGISGDEVDVNICGFTSTVTIQGTGSLFVQTTGAAMSYTPKITGGNYASYGKSSGNVYSAIYNDAAVTSVTEKTLALAAPSVGAVPQMSVLGEQFAGTVSWSDGTNENPAQFGASTSYTATVTLVPKLGYTFDGVEADFFETTGYTMITNTANSNVVTITYPATKEIADTTFTKLAIEGVTAPVPGETPVTVIMETEEYTGTVSWSDGTYEKPSQFQFGTKYTATITLTPKDGYTNLGVAENAYTVTGADATNAVDGKVITAVFDATSDGQVLEIDGVTYWLSDTVSPKLPAGLSWNNAAKTLTLQNYKGTYIASSTSWKSLNIHLKGNNELNATDSSVYEAACIFTRSGNITISADEGATLKAVSNGIGNVRTIYTNTNNAGALVSIQGGDIELVAKYSGKNQAACCCYGNLDISEDANVAMLLDATGATSAREICGVCAGEKIQISTSGNVSFRGITDKANVVIDGFCGQGSIPINMDTAGNVYVNTNGQAFSATPTYTTYTAANYIVHGTYNSNMMCISHKNSSYISVDKAVEPTCTTAGITQGSHCAFCETVIVAQNEGAPALGHDMQPVLDKATLGVDGKIYKKCSRCVKTSDETAIAKVADIVLGVTNFIYDGTAKTPTVTVKDSAGAVLINGTDYMITYSDNTNVGTASVTVTGKGNYEFTKVLNFTITKKQTPTSEIEDIFETDEETAMQIQEIAKEYGVSVDTLKITDETIAAQKDDKDIKGSSFGKLKAKVTKNNKTSVTLKWSKVKGADGYIIYGNRCNTKSKKYKCKRMKTLSANKTSYTAKKLKKGQYYKFIVRAYKNVNGKKVTIASSVTLHTITKGGKYGVAKSVKIEKIGKKKNTTKITLKKGRTATIKAKEIKESKPIKRHRKLVYESSNKKVATVSKSGKIKAKGKGKCKIYVYAQNGVYKTISVTVK